MNNENPKKEFLFNNRNYRFLLLSIVLIAIGFISWQVEEVKIQMFLTLKFLISAELDWPHHCSFGFWIGNLCHFNASKKSK